MSTLLITFNKIENEHTVLTWMFIRVRVGVVETGTMRPMGGNIVEVFSEKEKKETVSTVGGEG